MMALFSFLTPFVAYAFAYHTSGGDMAVGWATYVHTYVVLDVILTAINAVMKVSEEGFKIMFIAPAVFFAKYGIYYVLCQFFAMVFFCEPVYVFGIITIGLTCFYFFCGLLVAANRR